MARAWFGSGAEELREAAVFVDGEAGADNKDADEFQYRWRHRSVCLVLEIVLERVQSVRRGVCAKVHGEEQPCRSQSNVFVRRS